jgi:hypothetical protein
MSIRQADLRRQIAASLKVMRLAESLSKSADPTKHKCFVSRHHANDEEVANFLENFGHVFIPRAVGVSDLSEVIDSDDTDYVMDQIREKCLTDSTVTIVLVGTCTWARKYVDWEVCSTLRNDKNNKRSGLIAITLPSVSNYEGRKLPARVADNVLGDNQADGYARWKKYPTNAESLRVWIEDAFNARQTRAHLIDNTRVRKANNSDC